VVEALTGGRRCPGDVSNDPIRWLDPLLLKQWPKPKDRVIGHVVWAPPVSVSTAPHSYTKDVCVVKLDEKKFSQNFRRNVLDFGAC